MKEKLTAAVIGAGHAGLEAAFALAKMGARVLLFTTAIDALALMPCNPNIGGTGKGHLVREIDALGGEMALSADDSLIQIKMLNSAKGPAVHSLRGQADKAIYHNTMLSKIQSFDNITLIEAEVTDVITHNGVVIGVKCFDDTYDVNAAVLATGVYLDSSIIIGENVKKEGPAGLKGASGRLTRSLIALGVEIRRFKTGTPPRILRNTIDYDKMSIQHGDDDIHLFSFLHNHYMPEIEPCYLTYTNAQTHKIIMDNIALAPLFNGSISGVGPRYCPSIEDKVMRFSDKERHQVFVEPEGIGSDEMYIQGMSTSMPDFVQEKIFHSIDGLQNSVITKYGYAIEYDCIAPTCLTLSLAVKGVKGLYSAGQVNGSSGYEEAAAQGIMAGINAYLYMAEKPPFVLGRDTSYIGVLIDDLITKGTLEPYRMMTARVEHRLCLRQDNADVRLTPYAIELGLANPERVEIFRKKQQAMQELFSLANKVIPPKIANPILVAYGQAEVVTGITVADIIKRGNIGFMQLCEVEGLERLCDIDKRAVETVEIEIRYKGYIEKQDALLEDMKKLENVTLPQDLDYMTVEGLRIEARQKLNKYRPTSLGQASRISGINPSDINVLIIELARRRKNG